jgi:hypothetical protein
LALIADQVQTQIGNVLIGMTAKAFYRLCGGGVSIDGQENFHAHTGMTYEGDRVAALAAARALVVLIAGFS